MARVEAKFSEVIALLQRNALEERDAHDVEQDLRRLLLMARDTRQRDEMVQFQACERGRLSASSCDRWGCVSRRHHCSLFVLLYNAQCSPDAELQRIAAAAMLAFSVQNECQLQLDAVSGIPVLLRLLDYSDADVRVYVAATMWNMCKSPLFMLKFEVRALLWSDNSRDPQRPISKKTDRHPHDAARAIPPERQTYRRTRDRWDHRERQSREPQSAALVGDQHATVDCAARGELHWPPANAYGPVRCQNDWKSTSRGEKQQQERRPFRRTRRVGVANMRGVHESDQSEPQVRERHVPALRQNECGQTYHIKCSRWVTLDEDDIHLEHFHCDTCMTLLPLYYWDFVAENEQHSELLSENPFKFVAITRVSAAPSTSYESDANPFQLASASPQEQLTMLFNREQQLLGIGKKLFRIPKSSKDDEMFIVSIQFTMIETYSATQQVTASGTRHGGAVTSNNDTSTGPEDLHCDWEVSYVSDDASSIDFAVGSTMFWSETYLLDVSPLGYTEKSLEDLESAWIYEFQGEQSTDKMCSFSDSLPTAAASPTSSATTVNNANRAGLWTALYPRKGVCMKVLAEQIGRAKQFEAASARTPSTTINNAAKPVGTGASATRKEKPHFAGKKLNKVAVSSM
ncbi:hypothetical protein FI667_g1727, partial [Globisporangium splendens]